MLLGLPEVAESRFLLTVFVLVDPEILFNEIFPFDCCHVWSTLPALSALDLSVSSDSSQCLWELLQSLFQAHSVPSLQLKALLSMQWYNIILFLYFSELGSQNFFCKGPDILGLWVV